MSKRQSCGGRQHSVMLTDEMVAFVTESTNIDSVSVAVRALIRKAMKEEQVKQLSQPNKPTTKKEQKK